MLHCIQYLAYNIGHFYLVPFPFEYALYRIPVSPARHSRLRGNPELEVTFQYRQDHLETVLVQSFRLQPCEDQGTGNNPCIQRRKIRRTLPYPTGSSTAQARGKLALLVSLLALAILLLIPAVVFAEAPVVPQGLSATSGDGTMDLSWSTAERAEGGYQYRYATDPAALLVCVTPLSLALSANGSQLLTAQVRRLTRSKRGP